jgi:hypothetical protein
LADAIANSNYCKRHDIDQEALKEALPAIHQKLRDCGWDISYLPEYVQDKEIANAASEAKKNALQNDLQKLEEKMIHMRKEAGYIEESLAKSCDLDDFLLQHGLSPQSPEKLRTALMNAEAAGCDGKVLADKISVIDSLEMRLNNLKGEIEQLLRTKDQYDKMIRLHELKMMTISAKLKTAEELENMGCGFTVLNAIMEVIKKVAVAISTATRTMVDYDRATEKFANDVLTQYDQLVGLEIAISAKQCEKSDLIGKVEAIKMGYAKDRKAIDDLQVLHRNGVTNGDISELKYLVEVEGSRLSTLKDNIVLHGSLSKANYVLEKNVHDLDAKKHALELDISALETRKTTFEQHIKYADENLKKKISSIIAAVDNASTKISGASDESVKAISDAKENTVHKIQAIGETANMAVKQFAETRGVLVFAPLIRSVNGQKVEDRHMRDAVVFALEILLAAMPSTSSSKHALEVAKTSLKSDASFYFS